MSHLLYKIREKSGNLLKIFYKPIFCRYTWSISIIDRNGSGRQIIEFDSMIMQPFRL